MSRPLGQGSSALKVAEGTFKRCGRLLRSRVESGPIGLLAIPGAPGRLLELIAVFFDKTPNNPAPDLLGPTLQFEQSTAK
jgi:hypothetical protein